MMGMTNGEAVTMRTEHTKNKSYEPAKDLQPRKFGPASIRFPLEFIDRLTEHDTSYDPELNYALSIVTGWCYSDGQTLADKLKYYGLQFASVDEISVVNPAMLIVSSAFFARSRSGRVGVLAFRGTEPTNAISWLTDTDVIFRPVGDGMVHRGFYANLEAIWEEVSAKLDHALQPGGGSNDGPDMQPMECLYITGHSLGGAMAVVAAAKLFLDGRTELKQTLRGVYTYGQPAVGDRRFADQCGRWFGDRLYRHVFAYDVVARLPPASTGSFAQFGSVRTAASASEPWMTPEKAMTQAPFVASAVTISALSFVVRRLPRLAKLTGNILSYSFEDHSPTGYIEASRSSLLRRS
jgi:hypothetical protein